MKKIFLPSTLICSLALFLVLNNSKANNNKVSVNNSIYTSKKNEPNPSTLEAASAILYDSLKLQNLGLPKQVLAMALKGKERMAENDILQNDGIVTICDFSQPSDKKRLYIIDTKNYKVLMNTFVAHGKNTGLVEARNFSNRIESLQSSLGFYVTKGTYFGKHGLSLKLAGMEKGFNDNAEARAVVIHGADYIGENRLNAPYMGRSFGCPAVPQAQSKKVINLLKNGTCLFIYHPTQKYLHGSTILNG